MVRIGGIGELVVVVFIVVRSDYSWWIHWLGHVSYKLCCKGGGGG